MDDECKYWTFISYSSKDSATAEWLAKSLEEYVLPSELRLRHPGLPERLSPVCRDREEFPAGPSLSDIIKTKLGESRTLIVLCSPDAARSAWVGEEIRFFRSLAPEDRILALVVGGEPNVEVGDLSCIPPALRGEGDADFSGLAADIRRGKDRLDDALLKIIAGILRIDFDDLKMRDLRRRKWLAYRDALSLAARQLDLGRYARASRTLLGVVEHDRAFDHRSWEWGHLLLRCHRDLGTFECHATPHCLSFSPDGRHLAAGFMDGQVRMWAMPSGNLVRAFEAHGKTVNALDWLDGAGTLVSAGGDRCIRLWNCTTGALVGEIAVSPTVPAGFPADPVFWDFSLRDRVVASVSVEKTGTAMAAAAGEAVLLVNLESGNSQTSSTEGSGLVGAVTFAPAYGWVVAVAPGRVALLDRATGALVKTWVAPTGQRVLAWCADNFMLTGSEGALHLWRIRDGEFAEETMLRCSSEPCDERTVVANRQGTLLVAGTGATASLWVAADGGFNATPRTLLSGHDEMITAVALSGDGRVLATGSQDRTVRIWETATSTRARVLPGELDDARVAVFDPTGTQIAIGDSNGRVVICRVDTGANGRVIDTEPIVSTQATVLIRPLLAWAPDGSLCVVSGDGDPTLQFWAPSERKCVGTVRLESIWSGADVGIPPELKKIMAGEGGRCERLDVDPHGRLLVSMGHGEVRVLDLTREIWRRRDAHAHSIVAAAWSRVDESFFTVADDGQVCRWTLGRGDALATWTVGRKVLCAALVPHRDMIAMGGSDGRLSLLNLDTGVVQTVAAHERPVNSLVASADGRRIITAGDDGLVRVFSVEPPTELLHLPVGQVPFVGLSSDGGTLVYASDEEGLVLLDSLGQPFTSDEALVSWKRERLQLEYAHDPGVKRT